MGLFKYYLAISLIYCGSSFSDASPVASPRGCIGGNVIACGRFSMPSLIGLSLSVISLAVAFWVYKTLKDRFVILVLRFSHKNSYFFRLSLIFFLISRYAFTIKSLLTGSLIF